MIRKLSLLLKELTDEKVRENFRRIADYLRDDPFARGSFEHFDVLVPAGGSVRISHQLGFQPKDAWLTFWDTPSPPELLYTQFTKNFIFASVPGSGTFNLRGYLGAYETERTV